MHNTTSF